MPLSIARFLHFSTFTHNIHIIIIVTLILRLFNSRKSCRQEISATSLQHKLATRCWPLNPFINQSINRSLSVTLLFLWVSTKLFCFVLSEALTRVQDWIGTDLPPPSSARYVLDDLDLQFLGAGDMQACRARKWSWDLSARAMWLLKRVQTHIGHSTAFTWNMFLTLWPRPFDLIIKRVGRTHDGLSLWQVWWL